MGSKKCTKDSEINLKVNGSVVKDQNNVTEILADHFASIADGIGGKNAELLSEGDFSCHPSVQRITKESRNEEVFEFQPVNKAQVQSALEALDTKKATGCDSIPIRALNIGAKELAIPLTTIYNSSIRNVNGHGNGKPVNGYLFSREKIPPKKVNYRPTTVLPAVDKVFE